MKGITNETRNNILIIGGVAVGGLLAWRFLPPLLNSFQAPVSGIQFQPIPNCQVPAMLRGQQIKKVADEIYKAHVGMNAMNHPDKVNRILSFSACELQYMNQYFINVYGQSLYANISSEYDLDGDYDAAEQYLINAGLN